MQNRECIVFERTRDTAMCVFVSPVFIPSSTNPWVDHFHPTGYLSYLPPGIFYCMPLRKNIITSRNFLCLWSKIIQKASLVHHKFFCFKKRPNISLCVEYSQTLIWFFEDFKFAYKFTEFTQNDLTVQLWTKIRTSKSRKICCVKLGFQILYAVEQFSSPFSRDNLKQRAYIHQTHDAPSRCMSWENCCGVPNQQLPHVLALEGLPWPSAGKGLLYMGLPRSLNGGYAMVMTPSKGETAVHGSHYPRDMAVHMREVMARPWVGVCLPLALIYW